MRVTRCDIKSIREDIDILDESITNITNDLGLFEKKENAKVKLQQKVDQSEFDNLVSAGKKKDEK